MRYSSPLKLNHIFQRLYRTNGHADSCMVLYARPNRLDCNRVGFTVSKKLGHAVVRNRIRRRLREVYRLNEQFVTPGYDIVIVARGKAQRANFAAMESSFRKLLLKAGISTERPGEEG